MSTVSDPEQLFEVLEILGSGSFGTVLKCKNKGTGSIEAVKFIEISEDTDRLELINEINILKATSSCDFIVKHTGYWELPSCLLIAMEFCNGGAVLDVINAMQKPLKEEQIAAICYHILLGLQFMHSSKILHRDIKAGNVLLTIDGRAKLGDFGVSTKLISTLQRHRTVVGSPYWMSPEVIQATGSSGYDQKADIWSLGITAIEMAEMKPPHFEINPLRVIFVIPHRNPPTLSNPLSWSSSFVDFISKCLQKNTQERATATELLQHPFIKQVKDDAQTIIADLVKSAEPHLAEYRSKQKDDNANTRTEVEGATVKKGTCIHMEGGTAIFTDSSDSDASNPYATVQYRSFNSGSVIFNP
eukprot:TRINITY_DN1659_c0_g1_i1.p1 TRINITY_DN1659_c0_g1~~TRINITY_DN1659_c0_g1_i1.p1  ORF type:complete len:358 (-),score=80.05 TRINITY_DN1659_c0_g1_i1:15-1088(-)